MSKESAYFKLNDLSRKHDTKDLKQELDTFRGVISVSVNTENNLLAVDYDIRSANVFLLGKHSMA